MPLQLTLVALISRIQYSEDRFADAILTIITESDAESKTGSECITKTESESMTVKMNNADSTSEVYAVEARLASLLDFSYKAH